MATPRAAAILAGLGIATIYAVQIVLLKLGAGLLLASIGGDVVAAAAVLWAARVNRIDLGVRWPGARFAVAGLLVGLSAWMVALQIVVWVQPSENQGPLGQAVLHGSLWPLLFGLGLLPAFTEELVFRGLLARGLATYLRPWVAVAISSVVFAAYHIDPAQMLGVLPLALALGVLAIRSGSVVPGMIAHVTNNAIALVLSRDELPAVSRVLGARPAATLVIAVVVLAAGVALTAKAPA